MKRRLKQPKLIEKPLKILFFAAGPQILPSSRTRVYHYLRYLKQTHIRYKIIRYATKRQCQHTLGLVSLGMLERIISKVYNLTATLKVAFLAYRYDIIFIQKILLPKLAFNIIRYFNKNIIFDFDDALYTVKKSRQRLNHTLALSRYVIAENAFNRYYVRQFNSNILLLATPIDVQRYFPKREGNVNNRITIGWIGTPSTTDYLKPLYSVFKKLTQRYPNLVIQLVGSSKPKIEGVPLVCKDWHYHDEAESLRDFDIGIMPLHNDELSRGRGAYKLLLYMAVGIPCVASAVGINKDIIEEGVTGFLANSLEEWEQKLGILLKNNNLRLNMGLAGRKKVEQNYSYEIATPKLIKVFGNIIEN